MNTPFRALAQNSRPRKTLLTLFAGVSLASPVALELTGAGAFAQADPAIAYVASYTSRGRNYWDATVMNAGGTNRTVVWSRTSWIWALAWSPDLDGNPSNGYRGTLAVVGDEPATGHRNMWLLDVVVVGGIPQGTNLRVLVSGSIDPLADYLNDPEWSPDLDPFSPGYQGKIAFTGKEASSGPSGGSTINVIPMFWDGVTTQPVHGANSSELLVPATSNAGLGGPTWSPDGSRITYKQGGLGAVVIDAASGAVLNVITGTVQSTGHQWSRTPGSSVITLTEQDHLHIMDVDVGISSLAPLPSTACVDRDPTWSPDDRYIVFSGLDCGTKKKFTLRRTDVLTGVVTTLTAETGKNLRFPDWRKF